jgi:hypothetical protein
VITSECNLANMRYEARTNGQNVKVTTPTGEVVEYVFAADTDEAWYEQYKRDSQTNRIMFGSDGVVKEKIYADFNIVDLEGKILHEVRFARGS